MKIQLIRNATMRITLAGKTILTDPVLSPRHGIESFAGIEKNPTVELPIPIEKIIEGIDGIVVSHMHQDHFDAAAQQRLPKTFPLICPPEYESRICKAGFSAVLPVQDRIEWNGITMTRTPGSHAGNQKWKDILGSVAGFIFETPGEPTLYWCGDTILTDAVKKIISKHQPDIIITHSCGAVLEDSGPIVMDADQTLEVCRLAPWAKIVAVHLEALDHGTVTRQDVREKALEHGIPETRLFIPDDCQTLVF